MKKIIVALLVFSLAGPVFCTDLEGAFGLKFGQSPNECLKILEDKGLKFQKKDDDSYQYSGGSFNQKPLGQTVVTFKKDHLVAINFFFGPLQKVEALPLVDSLTKQVNEKYPDAKFEDTSKFLPPYSAGDGYEISAVMNGHASIDHVWAFPGKAGIFVKVVSSGDLFVLLSFIHQDYFGTAASDF